MQFCEPDSTLRNLECLKMRQIHPIILRVCVHKFYLLMHIALQNELNLIISFLITCYSYCYYLITTINLTKVNFLQKLNETKDRCS